MKTNIAPSKAGTTITLGNLDLALPALILDAGEPTTKRFIEFFTASIRNKNTREAYGRSVREFFNWCDEYGVGPLIDIEPVHVAAFIEQITDELSAPTVKLRLAAIKALFDYLVTGGLLTINPATAVRGPKHSVKKGKTPVLQAKEVRELLKSIPADSMPGLRDRALIATMTYSFARVSAALALDVTDVFISNHHLWLRLIEKGGKYHEVPCHHNLESYLRDYMEAAELTDGPLFRTFRGRSSDMSEKRFTRSDCWAMVKRRSKKAGIDNAENLCNHTFRGSGITAYLRNPEARLEHAQYLANHSDPKTTQLYNRQQDDIALNEIEKITI